MHIVACCCMLLYVSIKYPHCCMLLHVVVGCTDCTDSEFPQENSYTTTTVSNKGEITFYYCCNELTLAGMMVYFNTKSTFRSTASSGRAKVSACCIQICLSCAILCQMIPSSTRLVRIFIVSPVPLGRFPS